MKLSSHRVVRLALQGLLVLILAFAGVTPDQPCSPLPGTWDCACTTGDVAPSTDPAPEEARALAPELAAIPAKTEHNPVVAVAAAARVTSLADGIVPMGRVPAPTTVATSSALYVSHCAFLC